MAIWLNGDPVGTVAGFQRSVRFDVAQQLRSGTNFFAITATNRAAAAGVLLKLELAFEDGSRQWITTDPSWQATVKMPAAWPRPAAQEEGWGRVVSFGRLGVAPWGDPTGEVDDYNQWKQALDARFATPASSLQALAGFKVELLHSATREEGSWVSLAFDPKGRLFIGREGPGILRLTLPAQGTASAQVEVINNTLNECRGLLWAFDSLYANANNSKGFYRLRATGGDGRFDKVELLRATGGNVGHGRNAMALGPDGFLYLIHGNDVLLPADFAAGPSPFRHYGEDQLLPCSWNRVLMNAGTQAPAGHVVRTDSQGRRWDLVAGGFRNPYGIAFNPDGQMFTYDADMEWDLGAPWYRPTRVNHIVSGGDYGWRQGTGKWPAYFADSLPSNGDIGLGSPTGVKFGTGSSFPEKYRRALFALDWAYGKIYAVHLQPRGASYTSTHEVFLQGRPLNVTDLAFGPDGAMYFVTGGRRTQSGLYRVNWSGDALPKETAPSLEALARQNEAAAARLLRQKLEAHHGHESAAALDFAWEHLGSTDHWIRHAARVAVESQPVVHWRERALKEPRPMAAFTALLALARVADAKDQPALLQRLMSFPIAKLPQEQQLIALRALEISCIRMGRPADAAAIADRLDAGFPASTPPLNQELCKLLVYLEGPHVIEKSLVLLVQAKTQEERLHYLFTLRHVRQGWTSGQRRDYFTALGRAEYFSGEHYLPLFLRNIRADALGTMTAAERAAIEPMLSAQQRPKPAVARAVTPRPFVREWRMMDFKEDLGAVGQGRDLARGKAMFGAAGCVQCHRFRGEGQAFGPDLAGIGARFDRHALLESILEPSRVIDDKYRSMVVTTRSGDVEVGRLAGEEGPMLLLAPNAFAPDEVVRIAREQIVTQRLSQVSPMPAGLLDTLSRAEILDLLAYLMDEEGPKRIPGTPPECADTGNRGK
jgi:putative heme-binding domain-containing protein